MVKHIIIEKLILRNFKGIKDFAIDFGKNTNIFGDNGTGKTTISDAFRWLLFDKDSKDRSKFDIQPLDKENKVIHMLDTEVEAALKINEKAVTLKKVLKEKWVKKRGEAESELKGTETTYYIDEVPVKQGEYKKYINELIDENIFKLITDPLYFSTNMKWADRRNVLMEIIGDISIDSIINYNSSLKPLEQLLGDKSVDEFKKSVSASIKRLKGDKESIPSRVDELNRAIRGDIDFNALEFRKRIALGGIESVNEKLMDGSKENDSLLKDKEHLYKLKSRLRDIEYAAKADAEKPFRALEDELRKVTSNLTLKEHEALYKGQERTRLQSDIQKHELVREELKNKWYAEDKKVFEFDEKYCICPTCKREYETDDIEKTKAEMLENFNLTIYQSKEKITKQGQEKNKILSDLNFKLGSIDNEIETLKAEIYTLKVQKEDLEYKKLNFEPSTGLDLNQEYQNLLGEIKGLEAKIDMPSEGNALMEEFKTKKKSLELELENINKDLSYREQNEKLKERIAELLEQEKSLSQQIAALEGKEFLCEEFIKTKVELLESSINSKFKYVSFKLFDTQVNGGLVETCEALIDGVPFSNANTASQINTGLDIINALCSHYDVQAPIFIDNRESVNNLIDTNSQVINLIVSQDKSLKVEVM